MYYPGTPIPNPHTPELQSPIPKSQSLNPNSKPQTLIPRTCNRYSKAFASSMAATHKQQLSRAQEAAHAEDRRRALGIV